MDQRSRGHLLTKAIADREKRATQTDRAQNAKQTESYRPDLFFSDTELHEDTLDKLASMRML